MYCESRSRGRLFIMLHGSPSDPSHAMQHREGALVGRTGWRRIHPDLPGHGRTLSFSRIHDTGDYLETPLEFVDEVAQGGAFCIGGVSFGAYLALGIARRRQGRLDSSLLSAPQIHHNREEERNDLAAGVVRAPPFLSSGSSPFGYSEDSDWLASLPFRDVSLDLNRSRRQVLAPALFLFGLQDGRFRYRRYGRMLSEFPHATFANLDGAEHRVWTERPDLTFHLVQDWLHRVETVALRK